VAERVGLQDRVRIEDENGRRRRILRQSGLQAEVGTSGKAQVPATGDQRYPRKAHLYRCRAAVGRGIVHYPDASVQPVVEHRLLDGGDAAQRQVTYVVTDDDGGQVQGVPSVADGD